MGGDHSPENISLLCPAHNRYIAELLAAAPSGVAASKALIPQVLGLSPEDAIALTSQAIATQRVSAEGQEGLKAFLDKTKPAWMPEP